MDPHANSAQSDRQMVGVALAAAVAGGIVAWSLAWFTNLGLASLILGAVLTVGSIGLAATQERHRPVPLIAYAFGFVIVTWPLVYLVVGFIRYLVTGKALGD